MLIICGQENKLFPFTSTLYRTYFFLRSARAILKLYKGSLKSPFTKLLAFVHLVRFSPGFSCTWECLPYWHCHSKRSIMFLLHFDFFSNFPNGRGLNPSCIYLFLLFHKLWIIFSFSFFCSFKLQSFLTKSLNEWFHHALYIFQEVEKCARKRGKYFDVKVGTIEF